MNAIVLAGGFGTRLKPLTDTCPKPMLKIANVPMLDYVVAQLNYYGIDDMVFTLGYMPEKVRDYVSRYKGIRCRFSEEYMPLGTAGGVKLAEDMLDEVFFVVSGDALSDIDLTSMLEAHLNSGAEITMACTAVKNPRLYGVVRLDSQNTVTGFVEKPATEEFGNLVNAGVYVVNKSVLDYIPRNVSFDFSRNLFPELVSRRRLNAYLHNGYWCDIGDKESYFAANFFMLEGGFYPQVPSFSQDEFLSRVSGDSLVSASAVTVGRFSSSVIGRGARIASSADISDCIVMDGALVTGTHFREIIGPDYVEKLNITANVRAEQNNYSDKMLQTGV